MDWKSFSGGAMAARKSLQICENDVQLLVDLVEFARKKKYVVVNKTALARGVDEPPFQYFYGRFGL